MLELGDEDYYRVWMDHSSMEGQLECCQFLTITDKAALHYAQAFVCTQVFCLWKKCLIHSPWLCEMELHIEFYQK